MNKAILFALLLGLSNFLFAQQLDIPADAWKTDIDKLLDQLSVIHPNLYHQNTQASILKQAKELKEKAGEGDGKIMAIGLMQLLAQVGDANTALDYTQLGFKEFPVQYAFFGDSLRVIATDTSLRRYLGMRILKINQYALPEALEKLKVLNPTVEDANYSYPLMAQYLRYPELLHHLGIGSRPGSVVMMFEDLEGNRHKVPLIARNQEPAYWFKVRPEAPAHLQPPFDAVHPDFWTNTFPEEEVTYVYLADYPEKEIWMKAFKQLKTKLKEGNPRNAFVDLRWNKGSDFKLGKKLIRTIAKSKNIKQGGKIYVAIGRQTHAAAAKDAYEGKEKYGAILLGENTGASLNGYRGNQTFKLPNSGLQISIPTTQIQLLENHPGGLAPDMPIAWDWANYRRGRDPVWEWVRDQVR